MIGGRKEGVGRANGERRIEEYHLEAVGVSAHRRVSPTPHLDSLGQTLFLPARMLYAPNTYLNEISGEIIKVYTILVLSSSAC